MEQTSKNFPIVEAGVEGPCLNIQKGCNFGYQ